MSFKHSLKTMVYQLDIDKINIPELIEYLEFSWDEFNDLELETRIR